MKARDLDPATIDGMSDADLIARVLDGDRDAYQFLVQRHQESMHRVARTLVPDDDVAADIVQDAFVRAFVSLARCRDRTRFRVWLLATLRNRGLDYLREKRRSDLSLDVDAVARHAESMGAHTGAEDERYALRSALETALDRLSDPLREAFVLRHIEQLSVEETAAVLGTGISAVKMRVHRAREQLQLWLADDYGAGLPDPAAQAAPDRDAGPGPAREARPAPDEAPPDVTGDTRQTSWE